MKKLLFSCFLLFIILGLFSYKYCCLDKKQNILLIVVDTLSANHIPTFNKDIKIESNFISKLANSGLTFQNAYSTSSWTKPTITSILSGLYPREHGVGTLTGTLSNDVKTLPYYLKENGYQTLAVISHTILDEKSNILKDFDFVKNVSPHNPHATIVANTVTDTVIKKLNERDKDKPFLMFAHYFDPHYNYQDHKSINYTDPNYKGKATSGLHIIKLRDLTFNEEDKKQLNNLYHEEITYTDRALDRLYNYLKENNLLKNTIIVFTADHGEELLDRDWIGHTKTLYNELIRIPLIISAKNLKSKEINNNVSQIDILPTLLSLLKIDNNNLKGINLTKIIKKGRMLFSEVIFQSSRHVKDANKISVINDNYKLIKDRTTGASEFYNLEKDRSERDNQINNDEYKEIISSLNNQISNFEQRKLDTNDNIKFNKKELKDLESLGYL